MYIYSATKCSIEAGSVINVERVLLSSPIQKFLLYLLVSFSCLNNNDNNSKCNVNVVVVAVADKNHDNSAFN